MDPVEVVTDPAAQAALSATFGPAAVLLPIKERIAAGDRMIMFAAGDSTWNDSNDAIRQHLAALGPLLPDRTITHRLWSDALQAWGNLTTIQTGSDGDRYFVAVNGGSKFVKSDLADALVTDDLDVEVKFAADDWDSFTGARFVCADESSDPNRRWWLGMTAAGQLRLYWFPDGNNSGVIQVNSTANLSSVVTPVDGQPLTLRATLDVDNGAGGYEVNFFVNGQQLGDTIVGGSTTNLIASTRGVTLGGRASGAAAMSGKVYSFTMRASIDGPIIAAFDADHLTDNVTPYTDEFGITWTPGGSPDLGGSLGVLMLNGATAGKSIDYFTDATRWEAMSAAPVVNVAYIGLGHNAGTSVDFASAWVGLVDQIRARWPAAAIVASTQNPERSGAANWRQHAIRQRQVKETAIARGFVLVDAFRAFEDYGDWETDLMTDDIHPNADGSAIWAARLTEPFARALA